MLHQALPSLLVVWALCHSVYADDARPAEPLRVQMLVEMESRAQDTSVRFVAGGDRAVELVEKPVFRYDDQPRLLADATLWAWTYKGRPVAFQKVEAGDIGGRAMWQYCFASFAEEKLQAEWKDVHKFRATESGVIFRPAPGAPVVASRGAERRRQLRELARAFSARIVPNPLRDETQEMRLLTTPIYEYEEAETKLLPGAVFGYSTNGTNPDLLIAFEARPDEGKLVWNYAPARMTIGGITVSYGKQKIWECPFVEPGQNEFPTWTYFQTDRKVVKEEP